MIAVQAFIAQKNMTLLQYSLLQCIV